ncbi:MAG: hypothetical protein GF355_02090 [Candidatus Eisenbacteria bacterium]|nr:hypothetical protein [Candidatus Eisenbacteria bacterium]
MSSPSGVSVVFAGGLWHVVYEKDGDIYHRARSAYEWLPAEQLTDDPGASTDPHIARSGGNGASFLTVVWQDDRTGHAEVWSRRWNGSEWSMEECLTCDDVVSRAPVVAGDHTWEDKVLVAWEEAAVGEPETIRGRFAEGGVWGAVQEISQSPSRAFQPTAGHTPRTSTFHVAWADDRHGPAEIYLRTHSYGWADEERLTDLPGDCRYPSLHGEDCCGDYIQPMAFVLFEHHQNGSEIHGVCRHDAGDVYGGPVTPADGIPSTRPATGGFALAGLYCRFWGGPGPHYFVTWTDETAPSPAHPVEFQKGCLSSAGSDLLSEAGASFSTIAATEGEPEAGVMALWIESDEGASWLMSRKGSTPGCQFLDLLEEPAPSVVLGPEGFPSNTYLFGDLCTGQPEPGIWVGLEFDDGLDETLTWDPLQDHPSMDDETNADGEVVFAIRGGGCSEEGTVFLRCGGWILEILNGARSPDVDGDCVVSHYDLGYVQSMLGTGDFCADIDGSGLVDGSDLDIMVETLGDHCSNVTAAPAATPEASHRLQVWPNPCRGGATIRLRLAEEARVGVKIIDPAGRIVRDLGRHATGAGVADLRWDARDARGRPVGSGIYFVSVSRGETILQRPLLVLR